MITTTKISKIYANALAELVKDKKLQDDVVVKNFQKIKTILQNSAEFQSIINSPAISAENKIEIAHDVFKNELDEKMLNFIKVLIEKNRFNELDAIFQSYLQIIDENNNTENVKIISAIELKENYKKQIVEILSNKLSKKIKSEWITDENIIGGLIININDNIIDTSIKYKLENIVKGKL